VLVFLSVAPARAAAQVEILWDSWGVPHIFAEDNDSAFYAFGWAQAQAHGDLLLRLYGQARGQAAELFGESYLQSDRDMRLLDLPGEGERWYAAQTPELKGYIDAFARGVNAYASQHPEAIDDAVEVVLPVSGADVMRHIARVMTTFVTGTSECNSALPYVGQLLPPASNGWAIAPSRSASGHALLLTNPHLYWTDYNVLFEAHMVMPGLTAYGSTMVGVPVLTFAFNDRLGWTHTVNTYDGCDMYAITPEGDGYQYDGETRAFETETQTIHVRNADGSLRDESLTIRRSVQGPVTTLADGRQVALRIASLGDFGTPGLIEQWWHMLSARDRVQFEDALRALQLPMFNVIYGDADGNILLVFNGRVPVRPMGDASTWGRIVPGDTSETLWTELHPYDDLPRVLNPESGWVQNSNGVPWYMTEPLLDPVDYPAYFSAPEEINFREQRGIRMVSGDSSVTLDELVAYKYDTRSELADHLLDDLIAAARASNEPDAVEAADVLAAWDRQYDADSKGALLFYQWYNNWAGMAFRQVYERFASGEISGGEAMNALYGLLFAEPFDPTRMLETPSGLADPEAAVAALVQAAEALRGQTGSLDLAWGDIARLRWGDYDFPASGSPGSGGGFSIIEYMPGQDGRLASFAGDTYIAAVEFGDPVRALVSTVYGNATQPGSPHIGDGLAFSAEKQLRPALLTREDIEANLEQREVLEIE
jgi:acyl-homoserine-lactone acylase